MNKYQQIFKDLHRIYILLLSDRNKILNNEQIDNWITLESKSIMQRNSLFPKKNEMDNNA